MINSHGSKPILLIEKMQPKINKSLSSIPEKFRDDVEQDVKVKILTSVKNVEIEKTPGFYEFTDLKKRGI